MPKALQHTYPQWETDPDTGDERYVWSGLIRFVSAKRARKLRKRGVPLLPMHAVRDRSDGQHAPGYVEPTTPNGRARYAWFETEDSAAARRIGKMYRDRVRSWARMGQRIEALWERYERAEQGDALLALPSILQREDETDREFVQRHLAAGNVPEPPNEARALLGNKLSDELLAQRDAGLHYDDCDCAACDGSLN